MQYHYFFAAAAFAAVHSSALFADPSWDGFYLGLSLDAARTAGSVTGAPAHDRLGRDASLGGYAGFNTSKQNGFVWGGEIALSSVSATTDITSPGLGTSRFSGSFLLSPRLRAGVTHGNFFLYGLAGASLSDAVLHDPSTTSRAYTLGVSYGLGAEMKLNSNWSARLDVTRTDLGQRTQTFSSGPRATSVKVDKVTLGLSRKF